MLIFFINPLSSIYIANSNLYMAGNKLSIFFRAIAFVFENITLLAVRCTLNDQLDRFFWRQ